MILITGATGFVGRALVRRLSRRYKLRCIIRDTSKILSSDPNVTFLEGSLTDPAFLSRALQGVKIVVHIAAVLDPKDPSLHTVNVLGTRHLLAAARHAKVSHFIFLSTGNVTHGCRDAYTLSKVAAESLVQQFPNHLILREPIIYGPGDERYIGKLIVFLLRYPIIPIPGRGQWTFQPIFIDDLVSYLEESIQRHIVGTYTLAGKDTISYLDLVDLLQQELHQSKPYLFVPLSLLRFAAGFLSLFGISPPLTRTQLSNLTSSRTISLKQQYATFKHRPLSLKQGIKQTLRAKSL